MEMKDKATETEWEETDVRTCILNMRSEADTAKVERINRNKNNYDMYHLRHDFSHKEEGQSMEILSKQSLGVAQMKAFFQQALADAGEWWKCDVTVPEMESAMKVRPFEITRLTNYMLERQGYYSHVGNSIESAALASLCISKVGGKLIPKPKYIAKKKGRGKSLKRWIERTEDKTWETGFSLVRASNYYPDPSGGGHYEIEDSWVDYYELVRMGEADPDFDMDAIKGLSKGAVDESQEVFDKARETGQMSYVTMARPKVKLTEYWGTMVDATSGEVMYENVQAILANDLTMVLMPRPNPRWNQKSPYTASPLLEVANSVWHKALMDAPTQHNRALIEIFNLMLDAGLMQVHGLSQHRKDWMDNPAQASNGFKPGMSVGVNSMCPPGGKVVEPLVNVQIPPEAFNVFNILSQELNSSMLTNDLRQGALPARAVKATEVVEASQTITSIFKGMAENFEIRQILKELEQAWETTAQHWDEIDREVFVSLFGAQRGDELYRLSPHEVFSNTVNGIRFRVFGVTQTLQKADDFRKLTTLLQTIAGSPVLMEEYLKKYDLGKTLGEIMTALNVDKNKLEIPQAVQNTMAQPQPQQGQGSPVQGPQDMSQVPEAQGIGAQMGAGGPQIPHTSFPGSPALVGGNQQ